MKNFNFPFLAGVLLTSLAFVPVHFLYNKEAKLRCLENPTYQVAVTGDHFMGDTTICVHKTFIKVN
jgi:hypothetical protein